MGMIMTSDPEFYMCLSKEDIIKSTKYLGDIAYEINKGRLCLADMQHVYIEHYLILDKKINKVVYKSFEVGAGVEVKYITEHDKLTPGKLKEYLQHTHMTVDRY